MMDSIDEKTSVGVSPWAGCVVLFLQSLSPSLDLLSIYKDPNGKFSLFKVLKLTLSDVIGYEGYEMLKLHDADPALGVELKFTAISSCRRFLESYACGLLRQALHQHASRLLVRPEDLDIQMQLKAATQTLDLCLNDLEGCLTCISISQPVRLRDDEITQLEKALEQSYASQTLRAAEVPDNCFLFQERVFGDRPLTPADQQQFAAHIGRDWKKVGRTLQKGCRALKGPAIDNLAYEYEREGLYEQAYQLLGRFIQSEGRGAKLGRLIGALEENKLTSIAEIMLDIKPRD
ncbi:tumor necrosis factor receptor type 1-associated DEATH domain protein [Clupea harengus]|uniref:Tumor necrosis factor receptor type 1-associated DEATH domain protein n=1 Tax=Clupea harengus TaxID=7950 RepID=A0A6P3VIL4_CLUHA|nr:tumor necrosis factor receptor type 1-associated DEATH domain protein [Clupea harengus]